MAKYVERRPEFLAEQWLGLASGLITGVQCNGDAADEASYFVETAAGPKRVVSGDWVLFRDGYYQVLSAKDFADNYEAAESPKVAP